MPPLRSRRPRFSALLIGLSLLLTPSVFAQRGALTVHRSLGEMVQEAGTIVHGSVVSAKVEAHPQLSNLTTVLVTMNVQETLKGKAGKTFQFRQYIWDVRDRLDAAQYAKGQELVLLLTPVSQYGLSSPVGLEQGRFEVRKDSAGRVTAVNGKANLALFQSSEELRRPQAGPLLQQSLRPTPDASARPLPLADLKAAIRNLREAK